VSITIEVATATPSRAFVAIFDSNSFAGDSVTPQMITGDEANPNAAVLSSAASDSVLQPGGSVEMVLEGLESETTYVVFVVASDAATGLLFSAVEVLTTATADVTPPFLLGGIRTSINETLVSITAEASEFGTLYYAVYPVGAVVPEDGEVIRDGALGGSLPGATLAGSAPMASGEETYTLDLSDVDDLLTSADYQVLVVLEDESGNINPEATSGTFFVTSGSVASADGAALGPPGAAGASAGLIVGPIFGILGSCGLCLMCAVFVRRRKKQRKELNTERRKSLMTVPASDDEMLFSQLDENYDLTPHDQSPALSHFNSAAASGSASAADGSAHSNPIFGHVEMSAMPKQQPRKSRLVSVSNPLWAISQGMDVENDMAGDAGRVISANVFDNTQAPDLQEMGVEEVAEWLLLTQAEDHNNDSKLIDDETLATVAEMEEKIRLLEQALDTHSLCAEDKELVQESITRLKQNQDVMVATMNELTDTPADGEQDTLNFVNVLMNSSEELMKVENILTRAQTTMGDNEMEQQAVIEDNRSTYDKIVEHIRSVRANIKTVESAASNSVMVNMNLTNIEEVQSMIAECQSKLRPVKMETEEEKYQRIADMSETNEFQKHLTSLIGNLRSVGRGSVSAKGKWQRAGGAVSAMMMASSGMGASSPRGSVAKRMSMSHRASMSQRGSMSHRASINPMLAAVQQQQQQQQQRPSVSDGINPLFQSEQ